MGLGTRSWTDRSHHLQGLLLILQPVAAAKLAREQSVDLSFDRRALEKRGVVPRPKSGRIREDEVAEVLFFGQLVLTSS